MWTERWTLTILPFIILSDVFVERSGVFVERSDLRLLREAVREKCDL